MPLYEYQCTACAQRTEVLQRFDDAPPAACPACGGAVKKLVSSPAFQFKGSGWYVTDYARKGGGAAAPGESAAGDRSDRPERGERSEPAATGAERAAGGGRPAGSAGAAPPAASGRAGRAGRRGRPGRSGRAGRPGG